MRPGFVLAMVVRDSRGARGRLLFFTACLAVGVAAVVGVAALIAAIEDGIRGQSRQILGGDIAVESRRALPAELDRAFEAVPGVERTNVRDLGTMVSAGSATHRNQADAAPSLRAADSAVEQNQAKAAASKLSVGSAPEPNQADATPTVASAEPPADRSDAGASPSAAHSRLVELRVVEGRYPLFGELALEPARPLSELLDGESVVAAPELLEALHLAIGDTLDIGGLPFRIAGTVQREPDRLGFSLALGPRVFVDARGFARTSLGSTGGRIRHRALFALPKTRTGDLSVHKERLARELPGPEYLRIETHDQAQPDLRRSIDRVASYLGLVALLSLVLGGAGVAEIARAWIARRTADIAVMRCLGMRAREVLLVTLCNVALLALAGSALGAFAGSALAWIAPWFAPTFFPPDLVRPWQPGAIVRGLALGVGIALSFSLLPLTSIWRVSPARVLRSEVEPLPPSLLVRAGASAALLLAIFASAWVQSRSALHGALFTGGFAVLASVLFGAARGMTWAAARLPRRGVGPYLRHGIAALARPGAGTIGAIVALGLGVMVVVTMVLVERALAHELAHALPGDAPTVFLVDVQPDQWSGVRATLEAEGAQSIQTVPVVTARLAAIDGRSVDDIAAGQREERGRPRWVLTREQRLTWLERFPADNRIIDAVEPAVPDGLVVTIEAPWVDPEHAEVSLEQEFADDLGVGVGSMLRFDVQGIDVLLRVTSLRQVDWKTFGINFFLVVEPGVLERAPHLQIAAARLTPEAEPRVQDRLAEQFPNVTLLRISAILEKVADVLARLGLAVRILGSFTIVTGLAILAGVVAAAAAHRGREVALLKTLGLTRRGVALLLSLEHGLVGFVAGGIGASAAIVLAQIFLIYVLDLRPALALVALPLAAFGSALLAAACGVAASARALAVRPIESLRM